MRTVDPEARERKRNELLDAAVRCFAAQGYEATRTADICAGAGMSSGNLFHYFPSKHAVFLAAIERDGAQTASALAALRHAGPPFATLLGLLDHICQLAADPVVAGFALEVAAQAHRDPEVKARFRTNDRALRSELEHLVRAAMAQGAVRTTLTPERAATWLDALLDGVFARVAADPAFDPVAEAGVLRGLVMHLLQGGAD